MASRLFAQQEQGIEEAVNALRKKPGPARVVDLYGQPMGNMGKPCLTQPIGNMTSRLGSRLVSGR